MVKMESEIYKYFFEYLHHVKIFGMLIHILPEAIDFFVNFVAAVDSVQLIPKYK